MQFNLSEWALKHRSFVVYLMLVVTIAGVTAYLRLGRNEDPAFTFRTMIVQAAWPGATLEDTLDQVTERIEQTLKETPNLDFLAQLHQRGRDHHLREPERKHAGQGSTGHLVPRTQERR
jgi:multidrug efflux pump